MNDILQCPFFEEVNYERGEQKDVESDENEEEEQATHLGGSEPLTRHFIVGTDATSSDEEEDPSIDDWIRLSFPLFSRWLCALILCGYC